MFFDSVVFLIKRILPMKTLKKSLCLVLFLALGLTTSYAQDVFVGGLGGLNIATLTNLGSASASTGFSSASTKNKPRLLPHLGGYAEIKISEIFSVQPELLFSMKGFATEYTSSGGGTTVEQDSKLTLSYIDIPVQARFNLGGGFYLMGGPYVGIMLSAKSKYKSVTDDGSNVVTVESESSDTDGLNTIDVGMYLGAGYQMESGLLFGARWCRAFNDLYDDDPVATWFGNIDITNSNSVFEFYVGYGIGM